MSTDADPTPEHDDQGCSGCGGRCGHATPEECRGPSPLPWLPFDRCMFFYEARVFEVDSAAEARRLQVRITYHHCLRLSLDPPPGPVEFFDDPAHAPDCRLRSAGADRENRE